MDGGRTIPDPPTYAVIGSGAIGAYYGGCLQKLGREVHFHCYRDAEHVNTHGLRIESHLGDFILPDVKAYANVRDMPRCDVVLLALKTTNNHLLPELLPPVIKDGGVVCVLQNGLGIEADVARVVGDGRVMGGLCFICSHKIGPGHIRHTDYGRVEFADHNADGSPGGVTPRVRTVARDFEQTGNPVVMNEDMVLARWKKLVWNVPFNGLSVVLNKDTSVIMGDPAMRARAHGLMLEVQEAARASAGRVIEDDFVRMMMDWTDKMEPYYPSMKIDYDAGRPMEIEAIFGAPLREAERVGCGVPLLREVYRGLVSMERVRDRRAD